MVKKTIIVIAATISIASLVLNYFLIDSVLLSHLDENGRLKESYQMISLFGFPTHRYSGLNEGGTDQDSVIQLMDSTMRNMISILGELTGASGGIDENGQYMNPHGIYYVDSYFNGENYFRNNAIEFLDNNIHNYTGKMDSLGINSDLLQIINAKNEYYDRPIIQDLTVVESLILLESICHHILIDKYNYLLGLKNNQNTKSQ